MRPDRMERLRFFRAFLAHPRLVGAVLPTSRRAVRAMLDLADVSAAGQIVELGAGTGVYTREIVARLHPQARLLAIEIDPALAGQLATEMTDPRVTVVCDSAENVATHLGDARADVIVSGLPFTSLGVTVRRTILNQARSVLAAEGVLLVLQYSPLIRGELRRRFSSVRVAVCPYNVPPAILFACRAPMPAERTPA